MTRKRVLFVTHMLAAGGAARIVALVLKYLNRQRFEPFLVVFQDRFDFPVPEDVRIVCLHKRGIFALPSLVLQLARIYEREKPDTVVSTVEWVDVIALLAKKLSRVKPKLLVNVVSHTSSNLKQSFLSRLLRLAIPRLYPQANAAICISRGVANDLVTEFKVPSHKIRIAYGLIDFEHILNLAKEEVDHPYFTSKEMPIITTMGRLEVEKGHAYLLRAFAQVTTNLSCQLAILGEGKERTVLEKLTEQLGIGRQVDFLGFQQNPFKYLARSDVFVLPLLYEGFALAIIEAMACGIPVISTRCPCGPDETITDGVNGLLVPVADETSLAEAMLRLLKHKNLAVKLAQAGRKRADDFTAAKIMKEYEANF